jgi:hypothetical protein
MGSVCPVVISLNHIEEGLLLFEPPQSFFDVVGPRPA